MYVPYIARLPRYTFLGLYRGPFEHTDQSGELLKAAVVMGGKIDFISRGILQDYSKSIRVTHLYGENATRILNWKSTDAVPYGMNSVFTELSFYEIQTALKAFSEADPDGKGFKNLDNYPEAGQFFDIPKHGDVEVRRNFGFEPVKQRLAVNFLAIMNQEHLIDPSLRPRLANWRMLFVWSSGGSGGISRPRPSLGPSPLCG